MSAEISGLVAFNIPDGWLGLTGFYYLGGPLTVRFYEEEGGLGSLVGTLDLPGSVDFDATGGAFPLFRSAVFDSASGNRIDTLINGGLPIPEPGSLELALVVAAGVLLARYRRQ